MLKRNQRTLEEYMRAGAKMRLFKTLGTRMIVDNSRVLSSSDTDKLMRAMRWIDEVCSRAEDNMFRDYPKLSDEYLDVFYGSTDTEPRTGVDEKILEIARESAHELFKGTGH